MTLQWERRQCFYYGSNAWWPVVEGCHGGVFHVSTMNGTGKVNHQVENRLPTGSIAQSHTVSLFSMLPYLFVFQRWGMFLPWDGARSFLHVLGGIPRGTWSEKFTDVRQVWNKCRNWLSLACGMAMLQTVGSVRWVQPCTNPRSLLQNQVYPEPDVFLVQDFSQPGLNINKKTMSIFGFQDWMIGTFILDPRFICVGASCFRCLNEYVVSIYKYISIYPKKNLRYNISCIFRYPYVFNPWELQCLAFIAGHVLDADGPSRCVHEPETKHVKVL